MKNKFFAIAALLSAALFVGCRTMDLEKNEEQQNAENERKAVENEGPMSEEELHDLFIAEEMKVQDVEPIVVYVEKPVYVPESKSSPDDFKKLTGVEASKASLEKATRKPEHYKDGTFFYQYDENLVYEIYTQPYHLTDIMLEPGELVQGSVLISEDDAVWELTANVAKNPDNGDNIQHLFLKPAYSALDSSMVVITDRRVYHFRIKSFKDTYMSMVKFKYPQTRNVWATRANDNDGNAAGVSIENEYITVTNPEYLSFDYKMKYGLRKPDFLPTRVYDDGQKTYIVVDEIVLHKQLPVLFNEKNEVMNYSVHKNTFVVPRLINKVTLRLGKKKVIVEKKKGKKDTASNSAESK